MRKTFTTGLGALCALAFVSVMATAAPPDAFQLELIQLVVPPELTVAPHVADEVAFVAVGDARAFALAEGEYQIERMPGMVAVPTLSLIAFPVTGLEVGVLFDPLGKPAGAMVNA